MRRSERVQFDGGNGHRLAGIVDRPVDSSPTPRGLQVPVVVFSHCFTCNKDLKAIVRISRQLAASGAIVLRYDMTGLGNSAGRFEETNFATNLADLYAAVRFADRHLGPPTVLLGHSLGGAASLAAAADWPDGLVGLSGVATLAAPSDTRHLAELLVRMDPAVERFGRGEVVIGGRRWATTPQLIENLAGFDLPSRIARLTVPLMLFHSPVDQTVGFDHALRIMGLARESAPVSLVTLPHADHLLMSDTRDLTYVADVLSAWLTRIA